MLSVLVLLHVVRSWCYYAMMARDAAHIIRRIWSLIVNVKLENLLFTVSGPRPLSVPHTHPLSYSFPYPFLHTLPLQFPRPFLFPLSRLRIHCRRKLRCSKLIYFCRFQSTIWSNVFWHWEHVKRQYYRHRTKITKLV